MIKKLRILIVDDEPDILDILAEEFIEIGHTIFKAQSGEEAVECLKKEMIDVVISDYRMPNGNGMMVLDYVNKMNKKPLFFFVSGQSDISISQCLKAGALNFFAKPFDLDFLVCEVLSKAKDL